MPSWFRTDKALSYNKLYTMVIGVRGRGKTYSSCKLIVSNYEKTGGKSIYLRRYGTELKPTLFDPYNLRNKKQVIVKSDQFYFSNAAGDIIKEHIGMQMPLTKSRSYKSTPFEEYNQIIFDEFLISDPYYHYLKDEINIFLDLYETVNRLRPPEKEVRVIFFANAISRYNIYFNYFGVHLDQNGIYKSQELVALLDWDKAFAEEKKNTRFGKLIEGTKYADFAIDNKFIAEANSEFIQKHDKRAQCSFVFIINGKYYGIWCNWSTQTYYISNKYDPSNRNVYCFSTEDLTENSYLISRAYTHRFMANFIKCLRRGSVYYESIKIKNETIDMLYKIAGSVMR